MLMSERGILAMQSDFMTLMSDPRTPVSYIKYAQNQSFKMEAIKFTNLQISR